MFFIPFGAELGDRPRLQRAPKPLYPPLGLTGPMAHRRPYPGLAHDPGEHRVGQAYPLVLGQILEEVAEVEAVVFSLIFS